MTNINIGVDISMNSTGICIQTHKKTIFLSFAGGLSDRKINNSVTLVYKELIPFDNFKLIEVDRQHLKLSRKEKKDYSFSEKIKLQDSINTSNIISKTIQDLLNDLGEKDEIGQINIGFEGFSYGSQGSSKNDIAGVTYSIREKLFNISNNVYFYAPKTVKKYAGKNLDAKTGNANKIKMFEMFTQNSLNDENLKNSKLYQFIKNNKDVCVRNDQILKPLDDLIDSYFICKNLDVNLTQIINN